jgi:hypothetical protein
MDIMNVLQNRQISKMSWANENWLDVHDSSTSHCRRMMMKSILPVLVLLVQMGGKTFPHLTPHFSTSSYR